MGYQRIRFELSLNSTEPWQRVLHMMLTDKRNPAATNNAIKALLWQHMLEQLTTAQRNTIRDWVAQVPPGDHTSLAALADKLFGATKKDNAEETERPRLAKRGRTKQTSDEQEEHLAAIRRMTF